MSNKYIYIYMCVSETLKECKNTVFEKSTEKTDTVVFFFCTGGTNGVVPQAVVLEPGNGRI